MVAATQASGRTDLLRFERDAIDSLGNDAVHWFAFASHSALVGVDVSGWGIFRNPVPCRRHQLVFVCHDRSCPMNLPQPSIARRSPIVAALLTLLVPGLGHIYLGHMVVGLGLLAAHLAFGLLATAFVMTGSSILGTIACVAAPWCTLWLVGMVWAYRAAGKPLNTAVASDVQRVKIYVLMLALPTALVWSLAIREYVGELFRVPSQSMLPGIAPGARILVNKLAYRNGPIRRGDRVVFINPNARYAKYVKRVVALPGDVIEMKNDELIINEQRFTYTDVKSASDSGQQRIESAGAVHYPILVSSLDVNPHATRSFAPQKVPNGHCFVLGDNREQSEDSRVHGPVPLTDVVGRVEKVF